MSCYRASIDKYYGDGSSILRTDPGILPEDNAVVMFTSGMSSLLLPYACYKALFQVQQVFPRVF